MFVQNHMTANPKTIGPQAAVSEAWNALQKGRFHQLPVVDDNHNLLGIVTDRDLRSALGYDAGGKTHLNIEEVMTPDPMCIAQDATIEEAVQLLCRHRFGALPVMEQQRLVGIITRSDLLCAFHDLLGLDSPGSRIEVAMPNGAADLSVVVKTLTDDDDVASMVAARLRADGAEPVLYIRTRCPNPWNLERRLRANGAILLAPESAADGGNKPGRGDLS